MTEGKALDAYRTTTHTFRILCRLPDLLTQCTDVVSNSLHHKVSRFANNATIKPWTPGPHLLLAGLSTDLDLDGTKQSRERSVTMTSQRSSIVAYVSVRVCVCTCGGCAVLPR